MSVMIKPGRRDGAHKLRMGCGERLSALQPKPQAAGQPREPMPRKLNTGRRG